ncbi:hypothetical protein [Pandoraea norimbergensis]
MTGEGRWIQEVAVCIGGGPSLRQDDCDLVQRSGARVIAVNSSWRAAPFADVIYAGDAAWWRANASAIWVDAERWTCSAVAAREFGLNLHEAAGAYNSGLRSIELAAQFGARRIVLIGFDCSVRDGSHWHGNHPSTKNPNAALCELWKRQFSQLRLGGTEIINASRQSEIECFERQSLEQALVL